MRSSVEIFDITTRECEVVWQTEDLVEAPNWSRDGEFLVVNGDGLLYALPLDEEDPEPELIDTSFAQDGAPTRKPNTGLVTHLLKDRGMISFGQYLSAADAEDLRAYVAHRAKLLQQQEGGAKK